MTNHTDAFELTRYPDRIETRRTDMRDFTYPVVTGMFILGVLMILAATTSANAANAASQNTSSVAGHGNAYRSSSCEIRLLIQREANLQMEIQRSTAIHSQAEQSRASAGKKINPGCVLCKID